MAADEENHPAVLTGWVVLEEWTGEDGGRFLSFGRDPATTQWHAEGMLVSALMHWPAG